MKINVVLTQTENITEVLKRVHSFLLPLMDNTGKRMVSELRCLYLGAEEPGLVWENINAWLTALEKQQVVILLEHAAVSDRTSWKQLSLAVCRYLKEHSAHLTLFYGSALGTYLGGITGAASGKDCYTEALELLPFETDKTRYEVSRKVYSAHITGVFPLLEEGTVIVISKNGKTEDFWQGDEQAKVISEPEGYHRKSSMLLWNLPEDSGIISIVKKKAEEDIAQAKLVFIGGKGLRTKENYQRLERLSQKAGAACGCTRAVAMSGWSSFSKVVGISGTCLNAENCVLFGVSGAGPFMYGVESARQIIAINHDKDAPVFSYAHLGMEEDCIRVLQEMENLYERG